MKKKFQPEDIGMCFSVFMLQVMSLQQENRRL